MPRKNRSDSISSIVKRKAAVGESIEPPEGITITGKEHQALWDQYTSARDHETWRQMDLLLIAKIVDKELDIRKHKELLDRTSVLIENKRGTMVMNPLINVIDIYERAQLSIIRSLSLGVHAGDARSMNNTGQKAQDLQDKQEIRNGNIVSLLA